MTTHCPRPRQSPLSSPCHPPPRLAPPPCRSRILGPAPRGKICPLGYEMWPASGLRPGTGAEPRPHTAATPPRLLHPIPLRHRSGACRPAQLLDRLSSGSSISMMAHAESCFSFSQPCRPRTPFSASSRLYLHVPTRLLPPLAGPASSRPIIPLTTGPAAMPSLSFRYPVFSPRGPTPPQHRVHHDRTHFGPDCQTPIAVPASASLRSLYESFHFPMQSLLLWRVLHR